MTDASNQQPRVNGANLLLMGGLLVLLIGLYFLGQHSRSVNLNRSATGFDAVSLWLEENDIKARNFYGRAVLEPDEVGLRILPLFDVDLIRPQNETNDDVAAMAETDRDILAYVVRRKISVLPTLLVMPKWRAGVRSAGAIHPELLISDESADTLINQIEGQLDADFGTLVRANETAEVVRPMPSGHDYTLHYPQTLRGSDCKPLIGTSTALLLGQCKYNDIEFWILADPDLLNNHGLSQGDNAEAMLEWLPSLSTKSGDIVVDVSTALWSRRIGAQNHKRSWGDLGRFFEYPFSVIWWSLAFLGALTFWRAWRRFGAADAREDEENGLRASRLVSIDTKAHLLRLTGRDDVLLKTYVNGRLDALADEILGAQRVRGEAGFHQLIAAVSRRSTELADQLSEVSMTPNDPTTSAYELLHQAGHLDELIERTLNEFGRTRRTG